MFCIFSKRAYASVLLELKLHPTTETGGVLLGKYSGSIWIVKEIIFAGPNAIHKSAEFVYDHNYVSYQANMLSQLYKGNLDIIGLWHSHVKTSPFSLSDKVSNFKFAHLNKFGALSCLADRRHKSLTVYRITPKGKYEKIAYKVNHNPRLSRGFALPLQGAITGLDPKGSLKV